MSTDDPIRGAFVWHWGNQRALANARAAAREAEQRRAEREALQQYLSSIIPPPDGDDR